MNAVLKQLIPMIEALPEEDQAALMEIAREMEAARKGEAVLTPDEEEALGEGVAQAARGETVPALEALDRLASRFRFDKA